MTVQENRERLLRESTMGGPGLDGYAYQATIYCVECGRAICRRIVASYPDYSVTDTSEIPCDSNDFPQPVFFGESDTAEHCAECGSYLYGATERDEGGEA